ncbi:hypothetical protein [Butyrivibrio fibrisolvens]|uniref:Uncharacterized protein n=1 Tax=Butyrivibrio fibrisolvens TaxID=831 RepID=A0A317G650_BUTFI|nr:hypothetical protein [Butyrivibrio fibrisolvens]PWT28746.1 hypothetical protein CPT75_17345 [Butyrivibrio fibrisolvens]
MNEMQEFSQEMLLKALVNKTNENSEVLSILSMIMGEVEAGVKRANKGIADVKNNTEKIDAKLDDILRKLDDLENEFLDLKNENRDIEQKLTLMSLKLERMEKSVSQDEGLEDYYILCQGLYDKWEELDDLTRRLIPVAEYLFSKLQKYDKPDYSPVILELCRAIENELLLKIFKRYTLDLINREGKQLSRFLASDKANSQLVGKTSGFIKAITKASRTNKPEYTMGQMNTIMSLVANRDVVKISPLLQDFNKYLTTNTVIKKLLNTQYIESLNIIVKDYRNPSAHPGYMSLDKAENCKKITPEKLDYLLDCLIHE